MSELSITCLGSFAVHFQGKPITRFRSNKIRALLIYLALEPNQDHPRSMLAGLLWPEVSDKQALQSLRVALYHLRQSLDEVNPDLAQKVLVISRQTIRLDTETEVSVQTDAIYFQTLLAACQAHDHDHLYHCSACLSRLQEASDCFRGELLAGFMLNDAPDFEAWLLLKREMLHQQALLTFKDLAESYETLKEYDQAYANAYRLLNLDAYRETSHRQLMRLLAYRGLPDQALAQFVTCRQLLRDELGVEPAAETVALRDQIRQGQLSPIVHLPLSEPDLLPRTTAPAPKPSVLLNVPLPSPFFGRGAELRQLKQWLVDERCRSVAILGLGGMGKTSLAARCVRELMFDQDQPAFDEVLWRSLVNAPLLTELLSSLFQVLADQTLAEIPHNLDDQLRLLLRYLQDQQVLLVLDNLESVLQPEGAGEYRPGYESYSQLIEYLATYEHQSHLLFTSRERPRGYHRLERDGPGIRSLSLGGLDNAAGQTLLAQRGLQGEDADQIALINRYSGNPLALKLVSDTVDEVFEGNLTDFLADDALIFGDIRLMLDQHFERLTELEQQILFWLAIEREPMSPHGLRLNLLQPPQQRNFLDALRSLQRRALVEQTGAGFALQNVVTEYLTERLIEIAVAEIETGNLDQLQYLALLKAEAKEPVRQSQTRLILQPVAEQLVDRIGIEALKTRLQHILDYLRKTAPRMPGYAGGSLLNLLLHLEIDLTDFDFSSLTLWQADLRNRSLLNVNIAGADLAHCAFTQTFSRITAVAISLDGQILAGGGDGGEIRLYQLPGGQLTQILIGHTNSIADLAFSPNGVWLASGAEDRTVRLWDISQAFAVKTFDGQITYRTIAFSPESSILVCAGFSNQVHIWDVNAGSLQQTLVLQTGRVEAVAFNHHGNLLAIANYDTGCVELWQINHASPQTSPDDSIIEFTPYATLVGVEEESIFSLSFSQDGTYLAGGTKQGDIKIWDMKQGALSHILSGHNEPVYTLITSRDDRILFSGSKDQTLRVWDVSRRQLLRTATEHNETVWSLALTPDGQLLASGGEEGVIRLWDVATPEKSSATEILYGYRQSLYSVRWSADGRWLATSDVHGHVRLWAADEAVPQSRYLIEGINLYTGIDFSSDGRWLAIASERGVELWDMETGMSLGSLPNQGKQRFVSFAPNSLLLATSGEDKTLCVWDVADPDKPQLCHQLEGHDRYPGVSFGPRADMLVSWDWNDHTFSRLYIWDLGTGRQIADYVSNNLIDFAAIDPTGSLVAFEGPDFNILLWDFAASSEEPVVQSLGGHTHHISAVAFSPDGALLVSSGLDRSIRLWEVASGQEVALLGSHEQYVNDVVFSQDGKRVASVGKGGSLRIWHVETGACLHALYAPGPYEGMNITGVTGITEAQRAALKTLGAVEQSP